MILRQDLENYSSYGNQNWRGDYYQCLKFLWILIIILKTEILICSIDGCYNLLNASYAYHWTSLETMRQSFYVER
ncbi:unnamed protein product [Rhizophagus irregularis]|nr:unnamed protein product [Rhizophagus irregularis]CAB5364409.1 unnamed protein product [Rhizophagus irregularis]